VNTVRSMASLLPSVTCYPFIKKVLLFAFSALTVLVGRPMKNGVVGCWRGYLSGARCRLAYGPADATATNFCLASLNPDLFYLSGTGSPR